MEGAHDDLAVVGDVGDGLEVEEVDGGDEVGVWGDDGGLALLTVAV